MRKSTSSYPALSVDATGTGVVSHAGAVTLLRTAEVTGLTMALSEQLSPWRKPLAQFAPGKIILDLAVSLALGGDCLADIATLREHAAVFGKVPSDPTVSRLITTLAADAPGVLTAIDTARAAARTAAWAHAGEHAPDHDITAENPLVLDLDATLVTAHSDKEFAAPTYKRGFGFHPLLAFVDHGRAGTGEPLAAVLRSGNAGSNTAVDHIEVTRKALARNYRSPPVIGLARKCWCAPMAPVPATRTCRGCRSSGCPIPSDSDSPMPWSPPSPMFRNQRGPSRSTPRRKSATGPGSSTPPASWTSRAGHQACACSSGRKDRTQVRNCGSPTLTACG